MRTTSRGIVGAALLALTLAGCAGTAQPLPQAPSSTSQKAAPSTAPKVKAVPKPSPKDTRTTCDVVREDFLTGSKAQITAALKMLIADKTADATAREYAQNYLVRDAKQPDLRKMDQTLIQASCS